MFIWLPTEKKKKKKKDERDLIIESVNFNLPALNKCRQQFELFWFTKTKARSSSQTGSFRQFELNVKSLM